MEKAECLIVRKFVAACEMKAYWGRRKTRSSGYGHATTPLPPGCAPLHHVVNINKKGLTSARNQTQECQYYSLVTVPTELSREAKTMWYLLYSDVSDCDALSVV